MTCDYKVTNFHHPRANHHKDPKEGRGSSWLREARAPSSLLIFASSPAPFLSPFFMKLFSILPGTETVVMGGLVTFNSEPKGSEPGHSGKGDTRMSGRAWGASCPVTREPPPVPEPFLPHKGQGTKTCLVMGTSGSACGVARPEETRPAKASPVTC